MNRLQYLVKQMHSAEGMVKHDLFSDLRDKGYNALGLSQDQLNLGQQAIDAAKSVLPAGGAIPDNSQGTPASFVSTSFPSILQTIMDPKIAGIPVIPVIVVGLIVIIAVKR